MCFSTWGTVFLTRWRIRSLRCCTAGQWRFPMSPRSQTRTRRSRNKVRFQGWTFWGLSWAVVWLKLVVIYSGLVKSDPELTVDKTLIPSPPTRPKNPVFDNEDMGKVRLCVCNIWIEICWFWRFNWMWFPFMKLEKWLCALLWFDGSCWLNFWGAKTQKIFRRQTDSSKTWWKRWERRDRDIKRLMKSSSLKPT